LFASESFALGAAICIALSSMLISELKGRVDVIRLARWQMLTAFAMTGIVSLVLDGWRTIGLPQLGLLAASSLFGIVIASTAYFASIYKVGPRSTALLFSMTSPFALALGYGVLGETIDRQQGAGVILVLVGVVLAIGLHGRETRVALSAVPWAGIALGLLTALGQAMGSLLARPAMAAGVEPFTAMAVRSGLAAAVFLGLTTLPVLALNRSYSFAYGDLGIGVAAAFLGTGLGMSLLMAALVQGNVGVVSTLSSMTPVVILPMVWIRSGVRPPLMAWIGAALAVVGTALISL
jgi:drug/metabolite transporter (DMT)-like permease